MFTLRKCHSGLEKGVNFMKKPTALILCGDGINCERETSWAFEEVGADSKIIHINDLLENPTLLNECQLLALPGGFSFGDELGSGRILSLKMKYGLKESLDEFLLREKPIIGICNGFQVLVKLGFLPWKKEKQILTLTDNEQGSFVNRWAKLNVHSNIGPWMHSYKIGDEINLPIRHGEGRIFTHLKNDTVISNLNNSKQVAFRYQENVNGSLDNIAGLLCESGFVLGMMPHPEATLFAATSVNQHNDFYSYRDGFKLFKNAIDFIQQS